MASTIPYSVASGHTWIFSESLTVTGGFVHIISRCAGDAHETEIIVHRIHPDNSCDIGYAVLIEHGQLPLPRRFALQAWHEHMLARHQALFRKRPLPYLVQVMASLACQLREAMRSGLRELLRFNRVSSF